jgi:hypothetical protein
MQTIQIQMLVMKWIENTIWKINIFLMIWIAARMDPDVPGANMDWEYVDTYRS